MVTRVKPPNAEADPRNAYEEIKLCVPFTQAASCPTKRPYIPPIINAGMNRPVGTAIPKQNTVPKKKKNKAANNVLVDISLYSVACNNHFTMCSVGFQKNKDRSLVS